MFVDGARNSELNGVSVDGQLMTWERAFPRNYEAQFDHPRPLVPEYRMSDDEWIG